MDGFLHEPSKVGLPHVRARNRLIFNKTTKHFLFIIYKIKHQFKRVFEHKRG